MKSDRYGTLTTFKVDTTYVGSHICTKAVGNYGRQEVTYNYKYAEGNVCSSVTRAETVEERSEEVLTEQICVCRLSGEPEDHGQGGELRL